MSAAAMNGDLSLRLIYALLVTLHDVYANLSGVQTFVSGYT